MARAECSAPAVLTRKPDGNAFEQQRPERERLGVMPFVRSARFENLATPIEHGPPNFRDDVEILRNAGQTFDNLAQASPD